MSKFGIGDVMSTKQRMKGLTPKDMLGKKVKAKMRHIAQKMSGKGSLKSTGRNEKEHMMVNNTTETNPQ